MGIQINGQTDIITAFDGSLSIGGVEVLSTNSSGNVGIGTDNPTVFGTAYRTLQLNPAAGTGDGSAIRFMYDGGTANTNDLVIYTNTSQSYIRANGARNLDIMRNGSTVATFNANGIALPSGLGIDFSATSDGSGTTTSELLDDYEEGTWTPVLRGRTTAGTAVNNRTAVGKYTKVGRMVNVVCDIDQTCTGGTGSMQISGLPYAAHTGPYVRFMGAIHWERMPFTYSDVHLVAFLNDNNDYVWIGSSRSNTTGVLIDITSNRTAMQFSITYMTD